MNDCPRIKWPWLGCKFEPRYSETEDETIPFEPEADYSSDFCLPPVLFPEAYVEKMVLSPEVQPGEEE